MRSKKCLDPRYTLMSRNSSSKLFSDCVDFLIEKVESHSRPELEDKNQHIFKLLQVLVKKYLNLTRSMEELDRIFEEVSNEKGGIVQLNTVPTLNSLISQVRRIILDLSTSFSSV